MSEGRHSDLLGDILGLGKGSLQEAKELLEALSNTLVEYLEIQDTNLRGSIMSIVSAEHFFHFIPRSNRSSRGLLYHDVALLTKVPSKSLDIS